MKNIATLLLLLTIISAGNDLSAQSQGYSISGTVIDDTTLEPLMGVYVTAEGGRGAQTDRYGKFTISNLHKGLNKLKTMYYSDYSIDQQAVDITDNMPHITLRITQKAYNLDQVVVTATRTVKRLADTPELTTVIGQREIEKAGSTSLLETLQDNIPGLTITENAMGNNMRIRGLNSRYILFLVDGERLASEGAGGNINFSQIDVNNIKRIEVLNGAASALYGSNAVGGVINIITKNPIHSFEAGANLSYESNNTWKTRIDAGSATEKFSVRAGGFRNSTDGFDKETYAAPYEDWGGDLKLGYKPTERIDLNMTGRYFLHETNQMENSNLLNENLAQTHNLSAGLNGSVRSADNRNNLQASINYEHFLKYDKYEEDGTDPRKDKNTTVDNMSARLLDTYKLSNQWEFTGGAELNYEGIYARTTLGPEPVKKEINDINGFGQVQYSPIEKLDIVAGARYTHNSQFGSAFSPKLSMMYKLSDFTLRGSVGSAFRAPSIKELYYNFDHQGMFWIYGNPNLKAEKGVYSTISGEYDSGDLNISVAPYFNKINHKITQYSMIVDGESQMRYMNVSSSTIKGFDVNLTYNILNHIVLRGNYSFCDAKDDDTDKQIGSSSRNSGTASVTWSGRIAGSPFSLQFAGRMHSPTVVNDMKTKTYSIWKVVLVKPIRLRKHTVELTLKADNIFGFEDFAFVNPGRQFMAGIRYKFR